MKLWRAIKTLEKNGYTITSTEKRYKARHLFLEGFWDNYLCYYIRSNAWTLSPLSGDTWSDDKCITVHTKETLMNVEGFDIFNSPEWEVKEVK